MATNAIAIVATSVVRRQSLAIRDLAEFLQEKEGRLAIFGACFKGANSEAKFLSLIEEVGIESAIAAMVEAESDSAFDEITFECYEREKAGILSELRWPPEDAEKFSKRLTELERDAKADPKCDAANLLREMTAVHLALVQNKTLLKKLETFE